MLSTLQDVPEKTRIVSHMVIEPFVVESRCFAHKIMFNTLSPNIDKICAR